MQAYRITDWYRQFEVNLKNRAVDPYSEQLPLEQLRKSPLQYIRLVNTAHTLTQTDRGINEKAWLAGQINELAVYGLYIKLLCIAANQPREFRGWVLDKNQRPLTARGIADILGVFEVGQIQKALGILTDPEVGLLISCEYLPEKCKDRQTSGQIRKLPDKSGQIRLKKEEEEETETDTELNETKDASIFNSDVSVSAVPESELERRRACCCSALIRILRIRPENKSDITTCRDILNALQRRVEVGECTLEIFDAAVDEARGCYGPKKWGQFINTMKDRRFGYVPVGRGRGFLSRVFR